MSGRTRWMISATARAWALSGVARSRRSAPRLARFRLQLKVAMRTSPAGWSAAAVDMMPTAAIRAARNAPRMAALCSEFQIERKRRGARRSDREETDAAGLHDARRIHAWRGRSGDGVDALRVGTGARADRPEVFLIQQVR